LALVAVFVGLTYPPEVFADNREVSVVATSILAMKEETRQELDPQLVELRDKLEKLFRYGGYMVVDEAQRTGAFEKELEFGLPENLVLRVTPKKGKARGGIDLIAKIVRIVPGKKKKKEEKIVLETELKLKEGGTVLLGGPSLEDGVLILALEVYQPKPTKNKK